MICNIYDLNTGTSKEVCSIPASYNVGPLLDNRIAVFRADSECVEWFCDSNGKIVIDLSDYYWQTGMNNYSSEVESLLGSWIHTELVDKIS